MSPKPVMRVEVNYEGQWVQAIVIGPSEGNTLTVEYRVPNEGTVKQHKSDLGTDSGNWREPTS